MVDRKKKGLCFHCDDKFTPGHKCKKLFSIEVVWSGEEGSSEEEDVMDDNCVQEADLKLSLQSRHR